MSLRLSGIALLVAAARSAFAQDVPPEVQLAPTTEGLEVQTRGTVIDLQNIVTAAAKGVTTVQEAPAIVTVITADDIRTWGYRSMEDLLADIPGWGRYPAYGENLHSMTTRGQTQSMLYMHDGVSLFNATPNLNSINGGMPLE